MNRPPESRPPRMPRFAVLTLLVLLAACRLTRSASAPDAESIVLGTVGPTMHTDTVDAPFAVGLVSRARWSARSGAVQPVREFWEDVAVLDMPSAEKAAASVEQRTFAAALRTLMAGDPEAAAVAFGVLHSSATDPLVRTRSRVGMTMSLTYNSDWAAIARMMRDPDTTAAGETDPRVLQAGVERWARALGALPPLTVSIPEAPVTVPLRRSAFGTPVVTVMINGRPHEFWLDTGASMTLLSVTVAAEARATLASTDTLALGVVAGHIDARAIFLDSMSIGGVVARQVSAAVVNPGVLRLDQRSVNGVVQPVQIDGVIGADLLRHMDLVLDAGAGKLTISRPRPSPPRTVRNLFWVGYPVVRLVTRDGRPVLFGLDTGADGTYITTALLRKLPRTAVATRRTTIAGLGTDRQQSDWIARDIALSDGDYAITLRNTPITPDRRWTFITFDGVIGSDVALATRLHLDFQNGVFDVRPSDAARYNNAPGVTIGH